MLKEPRCTIRKCQHFLGVESEVEEIDERSICEAFPDGIPDMIAYGNNKHLKPTIAQDNDIVYEKEK